MVLGVVLVVARLAAVVGVLGVAVPADGLARVLAPVACRVDGGLVVIGVGGFGTAVAHRSTSLGLAVGRAWQTGRFGILFYLAVRPAAPRAVGCRRPG